MNRIVAICGLALANCGWVIAARADEPAQKFLDKLRENEYYDVANDYLDEMATSPLASAEFKARIKFEQAETLLLAAGSTRDILQIEQFLNRADQFLQEFAAGNPNPQLLAESERVRARTLFGRGNLANIQAQSDRLTVAEKDELQKKARDFFNQALQVFQQSLDAQKVIVRDFKVDTSNPSSLERRETLWRQYIETRFMSPAIQEQIADTYPDRDPDRKKLLEQAAAEFADIASDYARFTRGSYARIASARCLIKLGKLDEAIVPLIEVLAGDVPRAFKLDAAVLAIECWEKFQPPANKEICGQIGEMVEILSLRDIRDPKIAAIQLGYAKACRNYADELEQSPQRDSYTTRISELRRDAARLAGNVARGSNPLRDTAKQVIAEWNLTTVETPVETGPPTNLAEAKARAIAQLEAVEHLRQQIVDRTGKPDVDEHELNELRQQLQAAAQQALDFLDRALEMATPEVSRDEINHVRMRQAVAHFFLAQYYEAGVIGSHLLERYPTVPGTKEAAAVAMRAYLQLYVQAPEDDRAFEQTHLQYICDRIVSTWPDDPATDEAANILITLALQKSDLESARRLMDTMERGSPARAKLEIHMGRVAWNQYLQRVSGTDADPATAGSLLEEAEQLLTSGVATLRPEHVTVDAALGALNLAQLYLDRGDVDKAIAQLETAPLAPLDLIKQQLPPAADPKFVRETYRTALRAYVSGMRSGQLASSYVDKAHDIVTALRQSTAAEAAGSADALISVYYQLARELLDQLGRIESPEEKAAFAQSLATFMQSIQEQASDAKTLMWIGSTLNSVADELLASDLNKNAAAFQSQAVQALAAAEQAGFGADPNADALALELKRQKALAHRGLGEFDDALNLLVELLRQRPTLLNVQVDAAKTLQMQGDRREDANAFAQAVAGSHRERIGDAARPANVIWGWRQLAMATRGKEQFADAFFESLYNMAYCRLRYGELSNRNDAKESALTEIKNQHELFPELGGQKWKPKFVELVKRIQSSLGQPATGL